MTEVWKSQAKKFCVVCKCWFADNRASIDFHEGGERHKAAIARSLRENSKKQERDARDQASLNSTLAIMESGALAAMKKDGREAASSTYFDPRNFKDVRSMAWELGKRQGPSMTSSEQQSTDLKTENLNAYDARFEGKVWVEADDEEGRKYYFHMNTGETTWTKPAIFFTEDQYDAILQGRDPDDIHNNDGPTKKKRKRKPRHKQEMEPEVDLVSLNLPKLDPFKKNPEFLVPQILVPSTNSELPRVQHFQPGQKSTLNVKKNYDDYDEDETPQKVEKPIAESVSLDPPAPQVSEQAEEETKIIHVDGAVLKIEPAAPGAHLVKEIKKNKYAAPAIGQWTRVIRTESEVCTESPLTRRFREAEEKEEAEQAVRAKEEDRFEPKTIFTEKVTETITKKVKGPIEFKKKSGPRNIRKREE